VRDRERQRETERDRERERGHRACVSATPAGISERERERGREGGQSTRRNWIISNQ